MSGPAPKAADRARDTDRAYFAAHPGVLSYTRPLIPGECALLEPGQTVACVIVAYVRPGVTQGAAVFRRGDVGAVRRDVEAQARQMRGAAGRGMRA